MRQRWTEPQAPEKPWKRWATAAAISLVLQIPIIAGIFYIITNSVEDIPFRSAANETVAMLDPLSEPEKVPDGDESREIQEPLEDESVRRPDEIPEALETPVGQIVTLVPDKEEMPDEARFSSSVAMKVEKETRARTPSEDQKRPDRIGPETEDRKTPSPRKGSESPEDPRSPGESSEEVSDEGTRVVRPGGGNAGQQNVRTPDGLALMQPRLEGLDPSAKYSPSRSPFASDDYLAGVDEEGDENLLNSVPYRYAGFFERVKEAVRVHWDPNRPYRLRDPSGEVYGHKDRLTVLRVTLDSRGKLLETSVSMKSGLRFLDDEAVRAMVAASPFLNPPEGLVDADGKIRFEFGFAFLVASSRKSFFWRFQ